ncbi:MAG: polyprenyl synthetase family protein [Nitrospiraceae bacterium]|nr:MAG: polyprenyl synthetase family protein [Nitrospiraceae bacterium]
MDFSAYLIKKQNTIDTFLREYISSKKKDDSCPGHLQKSMAYSLLAGGKRLRAILVMASYGVTGRRSKKIVPVASAIELIHTYSLIHDDLPAMDNDDFRRNKPTNHRVFGEASAILAGDALLTDAFGMISKVSFQSEVLIDIIKELAYASGPEGMVGGQTADIIYEDKNINKKQLHYIHTHKTGALIRASVRIGALMAETSPGIFRSLTKYGENIGLAYQVVDDILDVVGSRKELGKSTGADTSRGKNTYPSLYGIEESQRKAESLIHDSLSAIKRLDHKADPLREIANYILRRRN